MEIVSRVKTYFGLNIADLALTLAALSWGIASEGNPLLAAAAGSPALFAAMKMGLATLIYFRLVDGGRTRVLRWVNYVLVAVVAWNLAVIGGLV